MNGTVFFVTELRPLGDAMATSTHILTFSLLRGLAESGRRVVLFAIDESGSLSSAAGAFSSVVAETAVLPSRFGGIKKGDALVRLCRMLRYPLARGFYKKNAKLAAERLGNDRPELIISHCPSVEGAYYGAALSGIFPGVPYYQFWSDPLAMSGRTPETAGVRRLPFRIAEKTALKKADRIIYGTEPLCECQKRMYPPFSARMFCSDIPCPGRETESGPPGKIVYAGSFYKAFRDITPLVEAVSGLKDLQLDVAGEGDVPAVSAPNVTFHGRMSPDDAAELENGHGTSVCVLNSGCVQIPGKVFYEAGSRRRVLVVCDSRNPYSGMIRNYLEKYGRFTFCENTAESIAAALTELSASADPAPCDTERFGERAVAENIAGGGTECGG